MVHSFWAVFYFGFKLNPHAYSRADSADESRFSGSSKQLIDLFVLRGRFRMIGVRWDCVSRPQAGLYCIKIRPALGMRERPIFRTYASERNKS